jgi:hypothetical protein
MLVSAAEAAGEALRELSASEAPVELEEFEISLDFEGRLDFETIAKIQREMDNPERRRKRFPGVRFAEARSTTPPPMYPRERLDRRERDEGFSRISIRLVLAPREDR